MGKTTPKPAPPIGYEAINEATEARSFATVKTVEMVLAELQHRVMATAATDLGGRFLEPLDVAAVVAAETEAADRAAEAKALFVALGDPVDSDEAVTGFLLGYLAGVEREHLQHTMLAEAADKIGEPATAEVHRFMAIACECSITAARAAMP